MDRSQGTRRWGLGTREDDSLFFNVSFTTNSSIKIIKFHFFQSFWEKERSVLAGIPMGMLSRTVNSASHESHCSSDRCIWVSGIDVRVLRTAVIQQ